MPYITPAYAAIRERILRDLRNLDADAHTSADSDNYIRASVTASAAEGLYDHQLYLARQILPDEADAEYLEQHCALRGIVRKAATRATGTLYLSGQAGSAVPQGTLAKDADGVAYQTTAAGEVDGNGACSVACAAVLAGALPDYTARPVTLQSAPSGVQSRATLDLSGGTDAEDDASLLARLLWYMRNPPGGGNAADYKRWAEEVEGVVSATVYPLRQGPGTVDIVITGASGVPSQEVVAACQAYIDAVRPCTVEASTVYAPVAQAVDVSLQLRPRTGYTLQTLQAPVQEVLAAEFALLAPGDSVIKARLLAAVAGLAGVADAVITAPAANVSLDGIKWARLGTVTLGAL